MFALQRSCPKRSHSCYHLLDVALLCSVSVVRSYVDAPDETDSTAVMRRQRTGQGKGRAVRLTTVGAVGPVHNAALLMAAEDPRMRNLSEKPDPRLEDSESRFNNSLAGRQAAEVGSVSAWEGVAIGLSVCAFVFLVVAVSLWRLGKSHGACETQSELDGSTEGEDAGSAAGAEAETGAEKAGKES